MEDVYDTKTPGIYYGSVAVQVEQYYTHMENAMDYFPSADAVIGWLVWTAQKKWPGKPITKTVSYRVPDSLVRRAAAALDQPAPVPPGSAE